MKRWYIVYEGWKVSGDASCVIFFYFSGVLNFPLRNKDQNTPSVTCCHEDRSIPETGGLAPPGGVDRCSFPRGLLPSSSVEMKNNQKTPDFDSPLPDLASLPTAPLWKASASVLSHFHVSGRDHPGARLGSNSCVATDQRWDSLTGWKERRQVKRSGCCLARRKETAFFLSPWLLMAGLMGSHGLN